MIDLRAICHVKPTSCQLTLPQPRTYIHTHTKPPPYSIQKHNNPQNKQKIKTGGRGPEQHQNSPVITHPGTSRMPSERETEQWSSAVVALGGSRQRLERSRELLRPGRFSAQPTTAACSPGVSAQPVSPVLFPLSFLPCFCSLFPVYLSGWLYVLVTLYTSFVTVVLSKRGKR